MGNPGCFPVGEELSLVEERAHDYNQKPDEKPTEHITRIMDAKFLFDELHKSRKRNKQLEQDLEHTRNELAYARKLYGGRKMGGSFLGKGIAIVGIGLAAYFGFDSYTARNENQHLRNTRYSAIELSEIKPLRKELKKQVEGEEGEKGEKLYHGAEDCFETIKKVERNYEVFARDALKYIDSAVPRGELEDALKEEVNGLRGFFRKTQKDNIEGRIRFCKSRYDSAKRDDLDKPGLITCIHYANEGFAETMEHYNDRSQAINAWLPRLRNLVRHSRLKNKDQMLARIAIEEQSRNSVIDQTAYHQRVFEANNASYNLIPVEPVARNQSSASK
jgi:hypothetical protein